MSDSKDTLGDDGLFVLCLHQVNEVPLISKFIFVTPVLRVDASNHGASVCIGSNISALSTIGAQSLIMPVNPAAVCGGFVQRRKHVLADEPLCSSRKSASRY